jgi:hypothetical protein
MEADHAMNGDPYQLGSVRELRDRYGLAANSQKGESLSPSNVPANLRHLLPYAEVWGITDDTLRADFMKTAPVEAVAHLRRIVEQYDELLDAWLSGSEATGPSFSREYTAFSAMRMAALDC